MLRNVAKTLKERRMFEPGETLLVGLSGGPDSVCLLHVLKSLEAELDIMVLAAHLNHRIRGIDAQKDALYCARLCDRLGVTFFVQSQDVPAYAKERKLSMEEAAREVRYRFLNEVAQRARCNRIAVGHNQEDQVETVLMNLMRGCGLKGLSGMACETEGRIIRPLLYTSRREIEEYCQAHDLKPVKDATNRSNQYLRNRIRHELLPFLEKEYQPSIRANLLRMSEIVQEEDRCLEDLAKSYLPALDLNQKEPTLTFERTLLMGLPAALLRRVIRQAYRHIKGSTYNLASVHTEEAVKIIFSANASASRQLPGEVWIESGPDTVSFGYLPQSVKQGSDPYSYTLDPPQELYIKAADILLDCKILPKEVCMMLPTGTYTKAFDVAKIKGALSIRNRREGDKMRPLGMRGTQKVQDIMMDLKIPRQQRSIVPMLCDEEGILWIVGSKMSEDYRIDETTQTVLRVSAKKAKEINR